MLCRFRMLCHILKLYHIGMPEQYWRITAILQYDVSGRYTLSFNFTNCQWWNPTPTPQTSQTPLYLLPLNHLLQVQVLRAFDLQTKMSNQTSDLPTLVQSFQRNFNSNQPPPPSSPAPNSSSQPTVSSPRPPPVHALLQLRILQPHAFQSPTDSTLPNTAHTSWFRP
jgi:hypothetical protein